MHEYYKNLNEYLNADPLFRLVEGSRRASNSNFERNEMHARDTSGFLTSSLRIGMRMEAVAVLDVNSVKKALQKVMMIMRAPIGRDPSPTRLDPIHFDRPEA